MWSTFEQGKLLFYLLWFSLSLLNREAVKINHFNRSQSPIIFMPYVHNTVYFLQPFNQHYDLASHAYSHNFCQRSATKSPKKYFFIFSFWCLTWGLNLGLTSNKPPHYILDCGEMPYTFSRKYKIIWKIFLRRLPLSRLLAKTVRVNIICHERFLQNLLYEIGFKL